MKKVFGKIDWLLCILIITVAVLSLSGLRPGHIMEGDFSLYVRQAQSICEGDMQKVFLDMEEMLDKSTDKMYSPTLYPWGFPLILAPLYALFGLSFFPYKILFWLLFNAGIVLFYLSLKCIKNYHWQAFFIALIMGIQVLFYMHLRYILSEIPFFFFVMLSTYMIRRFFLEEPFARKYIPSYIITGLILLWASQIRTEGVLLFPALLGALLFRTYQMYGKKNLKNAKEALLLISIPFLSAFVGYILLTLFLPSGYLKHIDHTSMITWERIKSNAEFYFHGMELFFPLRYTPGMLFVLSLILLGITYRIKTHLFEVLFAVFAIGLYIIWPHANHRHMFTFIPFLIFFFISGFEWFRFSWKGINLSVIVAAILFVSYLPSTIVYNRNYYQSAFIVEESYGTSDENFVELVEFVKEIIPEKDRIAFSHNRALYLYTGRLAFPSFGPIEETANNAQWYIYCIDGGNYFQYNEEQMKVFHNYFEKVYENDKYHILRIIKKPI